MVQSIGLVLCFHHTQPPGTSGGEVRRAFERAYLPLLELLAEHTAIKVSMHWSGPMLEWLENHGGSHLDQMLALVRSGQVEVVGGLHGSGILPALPERDVVGQVQLMKRWWKDHGDPRIRGAWLPQHAWDPSAARILGRLGFQYTVLEEFQFYPGVPPDGYYLTEREGAPLALFPVDANLARMIPDASPKRIIDAVVARGSQGYRCVTIAVPAEALGAAIDSSATRCFTGPRAWVRRFFSALDDQAHRVKLVSFGTVLDRMKATDRAYPPASVALPVAIAALGGAGGAEFAELLSRVRQGEDPILREAAPFLRGVGWEQLLARWPEVNRLHKRMLRVSLEVLRLRNAVRDGTRSGQDVRDLEEALEDATRALYRGQNGAAYVLGTDIGAQDGGIRHIAWSNLVRAEYSVLNALGEAGWMRLEQLDYDCDGRNELIVRTPHLCGIVAPSSGGSLVELDVWSLPGNILNTRARRPEPEHEALRRMDALPPAGEEPEVTDELTEPGVEVPEPPDSPLLRTAEPGLSRRLFYDRQLRSAFLDRFLGAEASLASAVNGSLAEMGDFVGADYQVLHVEQDGQAASVTLARDGNVDEGAAVRLLRVVKRFALRRDTPAVEVTYDVGNRYHEPVRSRFCVELTLNVDSMTSDETWLETADGQRFGLGAPGEASEVSRISYVDETRGLRVTLALATPARVWHFPVETISRSPRGLCPIYQGVCLMVWWPIELWSMERRRFELSLSVEC